MKIKGLVFSLSLGLLLVSHVLFGKEMLLDASSMVKQVKFVVRSGELIFTEKHQNVNGKITENWYANNTELTKEDYLHRMAAAEQEEKDIQREIELQKQEELRLAREEQERKKREEEQEFLQATRLQTLKRLVKLELEGVEQAFARVDKYKLEDYFVFEEETFSSEQALGLVKVGLVNSARDLVIKDQEELGEDELKNMLSKLEEVPLKVERFFRKSVKFAVNQCNDTRRLKELLALI